LHQHIERSVDVRHHLLDRILHVPAKPRLADRPPPAGADGIAAVLTAL
jgi:hypothetical protein